MRRGIRKFEFTNKRKQEAFVYANIAIAHIYNKRNHLKLHFHKFKIPGFIHLAIFVVDGWEPPLDDLKKSTNQI